MRTSERGPGMAQGGAYDRMRQRLFAVEGEKIRLGDLVVQRGYVSTAQLDECLQEQERLRGGGQELKLGQILLRKGYLTTARFLEIIALQEAGPEAADRADRLGRYVVKQEVGRGGMGVVYEAEDPGLRRRVALKVLREGEAGPIVTARLHREAQIAAQLQHPNIVAIHEVGSARQSDGRLAHYIAMEFVEGRTLSDVIREHALPRQELLRMVEDVARAVGYAHTKGVVHRDLKPSNILVDPTGRVRLTDFGLAQADTLRTKLTRTQAVMGTPQYMAPEQVEGRMREIDARTDVYSLGVILYEVLTGATPFVSRNPAALYHQILRQEPRRPGSVIKDLPGDLDVVTMKAMEKERGRRYQSATEFADDLGRFRRGEPIQAPPSSTLQRLRRRLVRRKVLLAGALLVLVGAVVMPAGLLGDDRAGRFVRLQEELAPLERALREGRGAFYSATVDPDLNAIEQAVLNLEKIAGRPEYADFPDAWSAAGRGRYLLGDLPGSREALERARAIDPEEPTVNEYLGRVLLEGIVTGMAVRSRQESVSPALRDRFRREAEEAARLLERARGPLPSRAKIEQDIARAYLALSRGENQVILKICEEGIAAHGRSTGVEELHTLRGLALLDAKEKTEAFSRALELRPRYPWARFLRAVVRDLTGDTQGALEDFDEAVRTSRGLVQAYVCRGLARRDAGRYREALDDLNLADRLRADDPWIIMNRGTVQLELGDPAAAEADLERSLKLDPGYALARVNLAGLRLRQKNVAAAHREVEQAFAADPSCGPAYWMKGVILIAERRYREALTALEKAMGDDGRPMPQAHLERGRAYLGLSDWQKAAAEFNEYVGLRPTDRSGWGFLAEAYLELGDHAGWERALTRVIQLEPENPEPYADRATARSRLGRPDLSLKDLDKALELGGPGWVHYERVRKARDQIKKKLGR